MRQAILTHDPDPGGPADRWSDLALRELQQRVDALAPPSVHSFFARHAPADFSLTPGEEACCRSFHPRRRADFMVGRYVATEALARLGCGREAILSGSSREPLWPRAFTGSIAHTLGFAGAVAARSSEVGGIGLDIERLQPLEEVAEHIATPFEISRAAGGPAGGDYWSILFSAKESIYKCLWPAARRFIGFHEVSILIDERSGTFAIARHDDLGPIADRLRGHWFTAGGYVVALAIVDRESAA